MSSLDRHDFQSALDPMLPRAGAEQRVLAQLRAHASSRQRSAVREVGMSLLAAAVLGGVLGLTFGLHAHMQSRSAVPVPPPPQSLQWKPKLIVPQPDTTRLPKSSPTPAPTPSSIDDVVPFTVSFPDPHDGWAIGNGCDRQQNCEVVVTRTTDGGQHWQLATASGNGNRIVGASAEDAWVWNSDVQAGGAFRSTHDGGHTWHTVDTGSASVTSVAVSDGTVWAVTDCALDSAGRATCDVKVLSSPVHSDSWTQLPTPPGSPQSGPLLVRSGTRSWLFSSGYGGTMTLARSDGGRSWTTLNVPCDHTMNRLVVAASSINHVLAACVSIGAWPAAQEVFSSQDGGVHWALRSRAYASFAGGDGPDVGSLHNEGAPAELAVTGASTAWMASTRGTDMVTHDDGVTWRDASLPDPPFGNTGGAEGIVFADALHGWATSSEGVWATVDGGTHWTYQPVLGRGPYSPS